MLREPLEGLFRRLDGAVAVSLVGADGMPIDAVRAAPQGQGVQRGTEDLDDLFVEYVALLRQVRDSGQMLAAGALEELVLASERLVTVIRPVNDEVYLALALRAGASSGKARYLCRITAPRVLSALAS